MTDKLPTYGDWAEVPDHLKTKTGLRNMGLKLSPGQQPVALKTHWHYSKPDYELFDVNDAITRPKATQAQLAALKKAHRQKKLNSRCAECGIWFEDEDYRLSRVKTKDQGNGAYICVGCRDRRRARNWAREVLTDEEAIILDTETTGLGDHDQVIEVSAINVGGGKLFDTLVKPTIQIPLAASSIHGITDQVVSNAPTFADIYPELRQLLKHASRVVIYNSEFDHRLLNQTRRAWKLPIFKPAPFECAMNWYALWYGDWSNYHQSYKWQKLYGNHRALGDCLACLEYIKEMKGDA